MSWRWLEQHPYTWGFVGRVLIKAIVLLVLVNVAYALLQPMAWLGQLGVYGWLVPYRERLPFGERPEAYNLSTHNLETLFSTHVVNRPKASDEFRVFLIGDSATWGILQTPEQTIGGTLNALNLTTIDGKRVVAYNLGYPTLAVLKDLLLLDYALRYAPDAIVWLVTLESLPRAQQLTTPLVARNVSRVVPLVQAYGIALSVQEPTLSLIDKTLVGQRRELADWLRLQWLGGAWATTGIDQYFGAYVPPSNDFEADITWQGLSEGVLDDELLAWDVLQAGKQRVGKLPLLFVNEPIFIADGENSALRYNFWYPRWAYDAYRAMFTQLSTLEGWQTLDLWDSVPAREFTDSPVHTTAQGSAIVAQALAEWLTR